MVSLLRNGNSKSQVKKQRQKQTNKQKTETIPFLSLKVAWTRSWATSYWWPCLSRGLDQMTSGGPFQHKSFYESSRNRSSFYFFISKGRVTGGRKGRVV